jgi:hypothetical protein
MSFSCSRTLRYICICASVSFPSAAASYLSFGVLHQVHRAVLVEVLRDLRFVECFLRFAAREGD